MGDSLRTFNLLPTKSKDLGFFWTQPLALVFLSQKSPDRKNRKRLETLGVRGVCLEWGEG